MHGILFVDVRIQILNSAIQLTGKGLARDKACFICGLWDGSFIPGSLLQKESIIGSNVVVFKDAESKKKRPEGASFCISLFRVGSRYRN